LASAAAMRISHHSASMKPSPAAGPLIAAMMGLGKLGQLGELAPGPRDRLAGQPSPSMSIEAPGRKKTAGPRR